MAKVIVHYQDREVAFDVTPELTFGAILQDSLTLLKLTGESFLHDGQVRWNPDGRVAKDLPQGGHVYLTVEEESVWRPPKQQKMLTASPPRTKDLKAPISLVRCTDESCVPVKLDSPHIEQVFHSVKSTRVIFDSAPSRALVVKKPQQTNTIGKHLRNISGWLAGRGVTTVITDSDSEEFPDLTTISSLLAQLNVDKEFLGDVIDFVITLGGDGTVLYVANHFKHSVPPLVSFDLGSLGFLTRFNVTEYKRVLGALLAGEMYITLRSRLRCCLMKKVPGKVDSEWQAEKEFQVLNEVVVDKGSSPHLTQLDVYCDDVLVTTVQADGVIVSTPTGSTAYSLSAGGPMIHPQVGGICLTPICPHSLSFRPVVFPGSVELRVQNNKEARHPAFASFDGQMRLQLSGPDFISITSSKWPVPTVTETDEISSWFSSLANVLHWNERKLQKPNL